MSESSEKTFASVASMVPHHAKGITWVQEYGVLLFIYGDDRFQDLRFTKIYTAANKIYGLLQAPRPTEGKYHNLG